MFFRWVALSMCVLGAACAPTIRDAAREASGAVVDEATSQDALIDMAEAVEDPKVARATQALADQLASGMLQALSSEQSMEQIKQLTQVMAASATNAMMNELVRGLRTQLTPAMVELARENGRALSNELATQLQPALGSTARTVGYNTVLGANQGLDEVWRTSQGRTDLDALGERVSDLLWLAVVALGLLTLSLLFSAVIVLARAHQARTEVTRLESATLLLATAMREKQQSGETDEIVTIVQEALSRAADSHGRGRLRDVLRMRRHH